MSNTKGTVLVSSGTIPSIPAGAVRDVQAGLMINSVPVAPHFVDPDGPCAVLAVHNNGRFSIWNFSNAELIDTRWRAEYSHSIEQFPIVQEPANVIAGSVPAPTLGVTGTTQLQGVYLITPGATTAYPTIGGALAVANPGDSVYVGPGTYGESVTIPAGVSLFSISGPDVTTISGAAPTGHRVTLSNGCSFDGFTVQLPTDAMAAVNNPTTAQTYVKNINLAGQGGVGLGVLQTGAGFTDYKNINYNSGACDSVFDLQAGSGVFWSCLINSGADLVGSGWKVRNSFVGLASCGSFASGLVDGLDVGLNGTLLGGNVEIENCTNAIHVKDDSSRIELRGTRCANTSAFDLLIEPAVLNATVHIASGEMNRTKLSIPDGATDVLLGFQDELVGDAGFVFYGEVAVGSPGAGKETVLGEGDSYTFGMNVFRNTNLEAGAWSDITAQMKSGAGSTAAIFPGVAANNACFIGGPRTFSGVKTLVTAALLLGAGAIDYQYWNGAAWVSFDVLATQSNSPYAPYANDTLTRVQSDQIRFEDFLSNWVQKTVNGVNAYWIRIVVTSPITTVIEQKSMPMASKNSLVLPSSEKNYSSILISLIPPWVVGLLDRQMFHLPQTLLYRHREISLPIILSIPKVGLLKFLMGWIPQRMFSLRFYGIPIQTMLEMYNGVSATDNSMLVTYSMVQFQMFCKTNYKQYLSILNFCFIEQSFLFEFLPSHLVH
jgi:hypothetical protein